MKVKSYEVVKNLIWSKNLVLAFNNLSKLKFLLIHDCL